jgi:hypothetical protein
MGCASAASEEPKLETPLYAPRRGPIADATAHERCLRGDGFGDGFGGDFLLVGRSTGGDSAPCLNLSCTV